MYDVFYIPELLRHPAFFFLSIYITESDPKKLNGFEQVGVYNYNE